VPRELDKEDALHHEFLQPVGQSRASNDANEERK
jgi:hypothetical protein